MIRRAIFVLLALLFFLPNEKNCAANPAPDKIIKFSGEVVNGQQFEKEIEGNLLFCLLPEEFGWTIFVGHKESLGNNFVTVVTPPYRGLNQIYIEGWHFRNSDNSWTNETGPKNVNAPQEVREFNFVLNSDDYQKASLAIDKMLWPSSYSPKEVSEAEDLHERIRMGAGIVTIQNMKLTNFEIAKQAGIGYMKFNVELQFPFDLP